MKTPLYLEKKLTEIRIMDSAVDCICVVDFFNDGAEKANVIMVACNAHEDLVNVAKSALELLGDKQDSATLMLKATYRQALAKAGVNS